MRRVPSPSLAEGVVPSVWGWPWSVTACLVLELLALFIYMEMDHQQGFELTCLNTTYLCHHPRKNRDPISAADPTSLHVSVSCTCCECRSVR